MKSQGGGFRPILAFPPFSIGSMLQAVPEAAEKIESGALGLSVLSKVQTVIRADEKRTGEKISPDEKSDILAKVESCSGREAEYRLASHFPDLAALALKEKVRVVGEDQVSVQVTFTREQFEKLKRIQELLSHTHIDASNAVLLDAAMDVFLEKKDPLKKTVKARLAQSDTAAEVKNKASRSISSAKLPRYAKPVKPSTRNFVFRKSSGQCEYRDPKTSRRCESRHLLEIDHIWPRALGGTNAIENLRTLCRTHNILMAEQTFGREKIEAFRRDK